MFSNKELEALEKKEEGEEASVDQSMDESEEEQHLHLIGIIENVEPGGVRAKFFVKKDDARIQTMSQLLSYDREWWVMKVWSCLNAFTNLMFRTVDHLLYSTKGVHCIAHCPQVPFNRCPHNWRL